MPAAIRAAHQGDVDADPDFRAVGAQVALLDEERNTVGNKAPAERGVGFPVIGMGYVGHAQRQKLVRRTADDLAKPLVDQEESTVQFALNDADAGLFENAGETLLAGAKRFLHPNPACGLDNRDEHAADTA